MRGRSHGHDYESRWSVTASRPFAASPSYLHPFVREAVGIAAGAEVIEDPPRVWSARLRRSTSLFDHCELTVTLVPDGETELASRVEAQATFESSMNRIGTLAVFTASFVGIPVAFFWRWRSIRDSEVFARRRFDRLFEAITDRTTHPAYR